MIAKYTRMALAFVLSLHKKAIVADCERMDGKCSSAFQKSHNQELIVSYAMDRLEETRLEALRVEQDTNKAWAEAEAELVKLNTL